MQAVSEHHQATVSKRTHCLFCGGKIPINHNYQNIKFCNRACVDKYRAADRLIPPEKRTCSKCKIEKDIEEFHKEKSRRGGHAYNCKRCESARPRRTYVVNKSAIDREKASATTRRWNAKNRGRRAANKARREARKIQAMPVWASKHAIDAIYKKRVRLEKETGEIYHVDHIVPLQGRTVCGLHCEDNLRVITAFENISKKNRHWPDMPHE